ncbi:MAG: helix-turn-helix transcriptional regulator [Armatimonadetes bacterium]|nr:helix-turn-helix transcriptional regulator [Armatimonadota bacterium]
MPRAAAGPADAATPLRARRRCRRRGRPVGAGTCSRTSRGRRSRSRRAARPVPARGCESLPARSRSGDHRCERRECRRRAFPASGRSRSLRRRCSSRKKQARSVNKHTEDQETFGQRIKRLRVAQGKRAEEIALRCKCSYAAILAWERDSRKPGSEYIVPLSDALGVTADYLLRRE